MTPDPGHTPGHTPHITPGATLVLATANRHKVTEMKERLSGCWPGPVSSLADFPEIPSPEETGATFEENARIKARALASLLPHWVLSDDSGLEVPALDLRPGVFSSRFAGPQAGMEENKALLLQLLSGKRACERRARFRSVLVLARQGAAEYLFEGSCEGEILIAPRGFGGFGYDPLFYFPSLGKSFAEITLEEKNRISHRGLALEKLLNFIRDAS